MSSRQPQIHDLTENYSSFTVDDDDEEGLLFEVGEDGLAEIDDRWLLVGRFLTNRSIDFQAMQNKIATLWQLGRGLYVKELDPNLFLFQFYHEVDIERVIEGSPWTFDRAPLIMERVSHGVNPRSIQLTNIELWVQLHNLTIGFMSEKVIRGVGNYIGTFVKSDPNNFSGVWRDYLRIRVKIPIGKSLKKKKKLEMQGGPVCHVVFKYEDLPTFCFICGILGHSERFCEKLFDTPKELITKEYGLEMKAALRRRNYADGSKWLRSGLATKNAGWAGESSSNSRRIPVRVPTAGGGVNAHSMEEGNQGPNVRGYDHSHGNQYGINKNKSPSSGEAIFMEGNVDAEVENSNVGLVFLDSKRRRVIEGQVCGPKECIDGQVGLNKHGPKSQLVSDATVEISEDLMDQGEMISHKKPNFVFLCEIKCQKTKVDGLARLLGFDGVFTVDAIGLSGGLALLWKNKEDGSLLGYSNNHIDIIVHSAQAGDWRLTGLYGEPNRSRRHETWNLLRTLATRSTLPWCIIGDTNNIVRHEEKRGGKPYPQRLLTGFNEALQQCNLHDVELQGHPFTWEKGRGSNNWIEVRLDRALATSAWFQVFPQATLLNLDYSCSDHAALFLEPMVPPVFTPNHRFRFENTWLKEPLCAEIVKECWENGHHLDLTGKLKLCAEKLKVWGKEITGTLNHIIKDYKKQLKKLQGRRDDNYVQVYNEVKKKLFKAIDQRESYWKQRAKQFWLREGDQNSSYFHKAASGRRKNNQIDQLKDGSQKRLQTHSGDERFGEYGGVSSKLVLEDLLELKNASKDEKPGVEGVYKLPPHDGTTQNQTCCYLSQWKNAHSAGAELLAAGLIQGDGAEHWVLPNVNEVKVNVDAAIFETNRQFGVGWVARDHQGFLIHGQTKLFYAYATRF
uniref:CCHC-type domain-containing protein n=1 Tax=Cannabis sativa TaxID=3483 RepID=A0A803PKP9_CANSA